MILVLGIAIALAAALRSTWSPCGLSMLSQLTPLAEAGRQRRFARTAGWYIAGATLGGLTLGCAMAGGALALSAAGLGTRAAIMLVAACALVSAAVDANVAGAGPPWLRRQVNADWLAQYRPWVYGGGFGWQIGVGITTYVMTAAVPLMIVAGMLSGRAATALLIGGGFGLARGFAVLIGARVRTPDALYALHRRFDAWASPVRQAVIGVQLAVAVAATWTVAPAPIAIGLTVAAAAVTTVVVVSRIAAQASSAAEPPSVIERYISGRR